ncbi:LOG family protein [Microbacterium forte]|uniref:LOG family protein n=1 Tax=Microbacterium forte TaxID=2982533 RepID=UPI002892EBA3|nr:TIGR00730 family Rossman fold protein [Microbacterium sp. A(2022)]
MTEVQSSMPKSVAIYCGSYAGADPEYIETARRVAVELAERGITIVYGGGAVGLMGAVADAAIEAGGKVVGVMPQALIDGEIGHKGLPEMHVVDNMHQRKALMADLADAFIALPGGAGTLEEIAEQWTWAQLGFHSKPCAFLNVRGFYSSLEVFARMMADEGFMKTEYADMLIFEDELTDILNRFATYTAPAKKWNPGKVRVLVEAID